MRLMFPVALVLALSACGEVWNDPYPAATRGENILFTAFVQRPKHLDPVQSYTEDEGQFTQQIYEPPLQYHYLKEPYTLVPLTADGMPTLRWLEAKGDAGREGAAGGTQSVYEIRIRPGILYQPHPAFARDAAGTFAYHDLSRARIDSLRSPYALALRGTRELVADDYIYQIKRLAHPRLHSPIFSLMEQYIVGLDAFAKRLDSANAELVKRRGAEAWLDLREFPLEGVERVDAYTFRIRLKAPYPQFLFWLAMPFFAPMPWEAERFFQQPGMAAQNLTLDWWPIGTGPYMLIENDPNARMVLVRNPNFRGEPYPSEGAPGDAAAGLLADAGRPMPFIGQVIFSLEKEGIPYWNKFLQGYYDFSGISSDNFDQAVRVAVEGEATLTPEMRERGIELRTSVAATIIYLGANALDPVVGGESNAAARTRARLLRQALAIAIDWEEYLSIFANGRGEVAHSPLTPGIFGYRAGRAGINRITHEWRNGAARRRSLSAAQALLAKAGYPDGRDARSGEPLVLYLDTVGRGPGDKPRFDWWRKQFATLGIQLEIRETDWNRFQEKIRKGSQQLFILGWNADYPDPENLMFLLHGPQGRARGQGENAANYRNPEFDALFGRMKNIPNSPERAQLIDQMVAIYQRDAPWIGGFHPKDFMLFHSWLGNVKPNNMARNNLKYLKMDPVRREALREAWNQPVLWPLGLIALALLVTILPALASYRRRERKVARPPRRVDAA
ncbi:MAG: peptide ABC transporter substrate-binding protein [Betaproteobacteria bacterium SG8_39]|nr:MAG: peptide ABC transporter substrate-binding protein [Betaproteobacteria bacterium SG8_39]